MSTQSILAALARADRFFARLLSFDLECPHCGSVYQIRDTHMKRGPRLKRAWSPLIGRFTCSHPDCRRVYILGIVAWPVSGGIAGQQPPEDQVPSPRQLAQMRKEGGGWWMSDQDKQTHARPHTTNLTTEEERPDYGDDDDE